jgi:predicted PurR-regulated permease PerM
MTQKKVIAIFVIVFAVCLLIVLHFSLLYCSDPSLCFYPVSSYPQHLLALKFKRAIAKYGQETFRSIQTIANMCLIAELVGLLYAIIKTIRNNLWTIGKIILLALIILYSIYRFEQYTYKHGPVDFSAEINHLYYRISHSLHNFFKGLFAQN